MGVARAGAEDAEIGARHRFRSCLDLDTSYWFAADAFNVYGLTRETELVEVP
jgi:hypothetical protein